MVRIWLSIEKQFGTQPLPNTWKQKISRLKDLIYKINELKILFQMLRSINREYQEQRFRALQPWIQGFRSTKQRKFSDIRWH